MCVRYATSVVAVSVRQRAKSFPEVLELHKSYNSSGEPTKPSRTHAYRRAFEREGWEKKRVPTSGAPTGGGEALGPKPHLKFSIRRFFSKKDPGR